MNNSEWKKDKIVPLWVSIYSFWILSIFYFFFDFLFSWILDFISISLLILSHRDRINREPMNLYYSISISSRYLPRKIPNWIQNWRVSVSLSMRLCTLEKESTFWKILAFVLWWVVLDPFNDLCCVDRGSNQNEQNIIKNRTKWFHKSNRKEHSNSFFINLLYSI